MISISPTQNVGSEKPRIEPAMIVRPAMPLGLRPAHRPSGMPRTIANSIAVSASSIVAGIRSRISPSADVLCTNERPRLPDSAPERNVRYCSHSGLSSPSAAIARSRSIWSACGLIRMSIGLPIAYTPTNTSSDITNSTTTLCRLRRMMKTSIDRSPVSCGAWPD